MLKGIGSFPTRRTSLERIIIVILVALLITLLLFQSETNRPQSFAYEQEDSDSAFSSDLRPKIAILSMTTDETSYDFPAFSTKSSYALEHGYDLIWDFTKTDYPKVWDKLNLTRDNTKAALEGAKTYEWLFMVDYDTLITNSSIKLEDIIERSLAFAEEAGKDRQNIDLILTKDCEPINAGVMFFRVSDYVLDFIDEWDKGSYIETEEGSARFNEQEILLQMLGNDALQMVNHSVVVPQTWFDAYPEELDLCRDARDPASWDPSMFLIHFAGAQWFLKDKADEFDKEKVEDPLHDLMWKYYRQTHDQRDPAPIEEYDIDNAVIIEFPTVR